MSTSPDSLPADATIGDRLRYLRKKRGLTQEELADLADLSADLVRKLERGRRSSPRLTTLTKLANALGVSRSELVDRRPRLDGTDSHLVIGLQNALLGPDVLPGFDPRDDAPTSVDELWRHVRRGWRDYWAGDFAGLARSLPGLIGEAQDTHRSVGAAATGPLAQAYDQAAHLLTHFGREELALLASERGITASHDGDDELQHAALYGVYTWALINQGRNDEAERVATQAAARIEPRFSTSAPEQITVWGSLVVWAMASATTVGRRDAAVDYITLAKAGAARLDSDRHDYEVRFGPSNMAMQTTCAFTLLGEPDKALAPVAELRREDLRPIDNAMHLMYMAQAQTDMRKWDDAATTLKAAKDLAPVWFRHQPFAHALVATLRERQMRLSSVVRELTLALDPH